MTGAAGTLPRTPLINLEMGRPDLDPSHPAKLAAALLAAGYAKLDLEYGLSADRLWRRADWRVIL